jgi:hypothetical protein
MKKVKVYVAWEREFSDELSEEGETSMENVSTYEFDTQGEADAFCLGINEGNGWDRPCALKENEAKIEDGKLKEDF